MFSIARVDAVNRMLQALDGSTVSSLNPPLNTTAVQANNTIDLATQKMQFENEWNFNYDGPRQLVSDNNSRIAVPSDYLYIRFYQWTDGSVWNLTVKNGQVWDRKNGTNVVTGTVTVGGSRLFAYEDCPSTIQNYIIEYAKYLFVGENSHLSPTRLELYAGEMKNAYMAAEKWDSAQKMGVMDVTPGIRDVFRQKGTPGGWWWSN